MTIDEVLVRELLSRREGERLEFKSQLHTSTNDGRIELAKDLIAIANGLGLDGPPGYILFGVSQNDDGMGVVVGIDPTSHPDDADVHEKVKHLLNRIPKFVYVPVEIEGRSVGVLEIHPGGRPFYPLKSQETKGQRFIRYQASLRRGSTTDVASPDEIQRWAIEDQPLKNLSRLVEEELLAFLMAVAVKNEDSAFFYVEYLEQYQRDYQDALNRFNMFDPQTVTIPNNDFRYLTYYAAARTALLEHLNFDALTRMSIEPSVAQREEGLQNAARRTLKTVRVATDQRFIADLREQQKQIYEVAFSTKGRDKKMPMINLMRILHSGNQLLMAIHESMNLYGHLHFRLSLHPQPSAHVPEKVVDRPVEDPINKILSTKETIEFVYDRLTTLMR